MTRLGATNVQLPISEDADEGGGSSSVAAASWTAAFLRRFGFTGMVCEKEKLRRNGALQNLAESRGVLLPRAGNFRPTRINLWGTLKSVVHGKQRRPKDAHRGHEPGEDQEIKFKTKAPNF